MERTEVQEKTERKHRGLRVLILVLAVFAVLAAASLIYVSQYYHAAASALELIEAPEAGITVMEWENGYVFSPEDPEAGLIFYPGAKVQCEAYAPLMERLAQQGYLCVLLHMPGNLAVLDINAADGIQAEYPEITHWYLAGHSMGGAMEGIYLGKHADEYDGLFLLAAYSSEDLSATDLTVVSIYGSEDGVLVQKQYQENLKNLPESSFSEFVIEGGCHGYFGDYGTQKGDGTPTITREEQIEQTAEILGAVIRS